MLTDTLQRAQFSDSPYLYIIFKKILFVCNTFPKQKFFPRQVLRRSTLGDVTVTNKVFYMSDNCLLSVVSRKDKKWQNRGGYTLVIHQDKETSFLNRVRVLKKYEERKKIKLTQWTSGCVFCELTDIHRCSKMPTKDELSNLLPFQDSQHSWTDDLPVCKQSGKWQ